MGNGPNAPTRLRCDFIKDPLGVTGHPSFSWWVNDKRSAEVQTAYEIHAASSRERLEQDAADLWLSGRIEAWENAHVPYQGLPLISGQAVSWRVRTYDSDGIESAWSEIAEFEMGLLSEGDFIGDWISAGIGGTRHVGGPVCALRRDFDLSEASVLGRLHIGVKGQARVLVNRQEVVDLQPVWLDFGRRYPRYTVDITDYLVNGVNSIVIFIADGVYAGTVPGQGRELYGELGRVKVWMVSEGESGRKVEISSGSDWRWRPTWVGGSEYLLGDTIDLRHKNLSFENQPPLYEWGHVKLHLDHGEEAAADWQLPSTIERANPVAPPTRRLINSPSGPKRIISSVEFAQPIMGNAILLTSGKEVDQIDVRYFLDDEGLVATDRYTTIGDGKQELLQTEFARHFFTSVEVEYSVRSTLVDTISATVVEPQVANFDLTTDHATLNKLIDAMQQMQKMVMQSAPLRGVQPDQRLPDIGYASTWITPLAINPENHVLLSKWLDDAQRTPIGQTSPYDSGRLAAGHDTDEYARFESLLELAWGLYRYQNAHEALVKAYPLLRAMALGYRHLAENLLRQPRADLYGHGDTGSLVATARFYGYLRRLIEIAHLLNEHGDQEIIGQLADQVKEAFRRRFITGDGHVVGDSTSALLAVLHWQMLDEKEEKRVQKELLGRVRSSKYQVEVVPAVTRALLPEITRAGRLDMAYMVLLQTTPTSWMGRLLAGDKLVYADESPDIAQSGLWDWLLENVVGITFGRPIDIEDNGLRHFRLKPKPPLGAQFQAGAPINQVSTRFTSLYGEIEVDWEIGERAFTLELLLPPGCSAEVELPDGVTQYVQSGSHNFAMEYSRGGDGVPTLREVHAK